MLSQWKILFVQIGEQVDDSEWHVVGEQVDDSGWHVAGWLLVWGCAKMLMGMLSWLDPNTCRSAVSDNRETKSQRQKRDGRPLLEVSLMDREQGITWTWFDCGHL